MKGKNQNMHFQEEKSHLAKMGPKDVSGLERSVLETDNLLDLWEGGGVKQQPLTQMSH